VRQTGGLPLGGDERVDRVTQYSVLRTQYRHGRPADRLEGPKPAGLIGYDFFRDPALPRVRGARLDPLDKVGDGLVRQSGLLGWHRQVALVPDGLNEQALGRVPRHDGRATVAAGAQPVPGVQPQPAAELLRLGGVALVTVRGKDRLDLLAKEAGGVRVLGASAAGADGSRQRREAEEFNCTRTVATGSHGR
jgi:hypothetical protein